MADPQIDVTSAWFAGPKAENAGWFSERLRQIVEDYYAWRRNYFPEDGVVVDSALRFIDLHGTQGLSMRKLAQDLGVEAMSLYRYVTGREDILEAVVTRLLGGVTEALDTQLAQTWQGYLQTLAHTVRDLARFDIALDDNLLRRDFREIAWTNVTNSRGAALPMGLGWFVQTYNGERLIWQLGNVRDAGSSLLLKVPGRNLTLILLANGDGLAPAEALTTGDITTSLYVKLFLKLFVL